MYRRYSDNGFLIFFRGVLFLLLYSFISLMLEQYAIKVPLFTTQFNSLINLLFLLSGIALVFQNRTVRSKDSWFLILAVFSTISTLSNSAVYSTSITRVVLFVCNQLFWFSILMICDRCFSKIQDFDRLLDAIIAFAYVVLAINSLFFINRFVKSSATVYYGLCLTPIFLLRNKSLLSKVAVFIVGALLLISNKRTGIIALILSLMAYIIINGKVRGEKNKVLNRAFYFLFIMLLLYIGISIVNFRYGVDIVSNFIGLASDGGSHRDVIYSSVVEAIKNSNGVNLWLGHGFNSVYYNRVAFDVSTASFTSAHSDFLEVLYDYGIIGLVSYLMVILRFGMHFLDMYRYRYRNTAIYAVSYIIFIVLSAFSHLIIYQTYIAIILMIWCYLIHDFKVSIENTNIA